MILNMKFLNAPEIIYNIIYKIDDSARITKKSIQP